MPGSKDFSEVHTLRIGPAQHLRAPRTAIDFLADVLNRTAALGPIGPGLYAFFKQERDISVAFGEKIGNSTYA